MEINNEIVMEKNNEIIIEINDEDNNVESCRQ